MRIPGPMALLAACAIALSSAAFAQGHGASRSPGALDPDRSLEISQAAIGRTIGSYQFVDSKGQAIVLDELRGKPLVVSLIYTSCNHVCPMITQRLRQAVEQGQRLIGSDRFVVLTVGFDTRNDTPIRMAAYGRAQGLDAPNWLLLSGDAASIGALARDLGFTYAPGAGGYEHAAQITIVDRNGRVYRQVYGDDFPIQVFMEPLKEAVYGTVGTLLSASGLIDRVRFLCTVYDPNLGRYRISYAIALSLLTGSLSLGATAFVIWRAWLKAQRA